MDFLPLYHLCDYLSCSEAAAYCSRHLCHHLRSSADSVLADSLSLACSLPDGKLLGDIIASVKTWTAVPAAYFDALPMEYMMRFLKEPEYYSLPWLTGTSCALATVREGKLLKIAAEYLEERDVDWLKANATKILTCLRLTYVCFALEGELSVRNLSWLLDDGVLAGHVSAAREALTTPYLELPASSASFWTPRPRSLECSGWSPQEYASDPDVPPDCGFRKFARSPGVRIKQLQLYKRKMHRNDCHTVVAGLTISWSDDSQDTAGDTDCSSVQTMVIPDYAGCHLYLDVTGSYIRNCTLDIFQTLTSVPRTVPACDAVQPGQGPAHARGDAADHGRRLLQRPLAPGGAGR